MSGKFALIIGNTDYSDPGLARLTAPGRDAEDFARLLRDPNICSFDDVRTLSNELSSSVIEAMDEFFDLRKPDDLLVLYFSGHGIRDEFGSLYLAFKNTIRSRLRSTAIKAEYVREAMDQSRSKRQLLILDCCNSGAFPQGAKAELGGAMGMVSTFQGYGRYVLTASDATQFAWEGDKVIGGTQNSLFTHFLIKGLQGAADRDSDGKITIDELYDFAFEQISRATPEQTPTKSASKQEGDIILRQITRLEDIRPVVLPEELLEATEDSRTFVRESAVQQLEKLLHGRNLGLARSAKAVLEKIAEQDDSNRVRQLAGQSLRTLQEPAQGIVLQDMLAQAAGTAAQGPPDPRETETGIAEKQPPEQPGASMGPRATPQPQRAFAGHVAEQVSTTSEGTLTDGVAQQEDQQDRSELRAASRRHGPSAWMAIAWPAKPDSKGLLRIGAAGAAVVVIALSSFYGLQSIRAASRRLTVPPTSSLEASSATAAPVAVLSDSATTEPAHTSPPGEHTPTPGAPSTFTLAPAGIAASSDATSTPVFSAYVESRNGLESYRTGGVLAAALPHGNVYIMNGNDSIYLLIDVVTDTVNDLYNGTTTSDWLDVYIDANNDRKLGVNDFVYRFSAGPYGENGLDVIRGPADGSCSHGPQDYEALGWRSTSSMWLGFAPTPFLAESHRYYDLGISLRDIGVAVGETVRLALSYYSANPYFSDNFPSNSTDCNMTDAIPFQVTSP